MALAHRGRVHLHARWPLAGTRTRPVLAWTDAGRRHAGPGHARHRPRPGHRGRGGPRARPAAARLPPVRERAARPRRARRSTSTSDGVRAVGPLLDGGRHEPLRMVAPAPIRAGDPLPGTVQPHGVVPLPEADERQRPGRPGGGPDPVLGAARPAGAGCPRTSGCSRCRGPTRTTTGSSPTVRTCVPRPPSRDRRPAGAVAGRGRHRRRGPRRPVLVLPLRRADRRARARPVPRRSGPVAHRDRRARVRRRSREQLRHPLHRHHGGSACAPIPARSGLVTGLGWYSDQARRRAVVDGATGGGVPPRTSAGRRWTRLPQRTPASDYEGDATIETYTVVHDRDGRARARHPGPAHPDGRRTWGNVTDRDDMRAHGARGLRAPRRASAPTAAPSCGDIDVGGPMTRRSTTSPHD